MYALLSMPWMLNFKIQHATNLYRAKVLGFFENDRSFSVVVCVSVCISTPSLCVSCVYGYNNNNAISTRILRLFLPLQPYQIIKLGYTGCKFHVADASVES